jgi:hypothetical protein
LSRKAEICSAQVVRRSVFELSAIHGKYVSLVNIWFAEGDGLPFSWSILTDSRRNVAGATENNSL